MNNRSVTISLRVKLAFSFALLSSLSVGLVSYFYYQNLKTQLREDLRQRLLETVSIAALQVDAESHAKLTEPSQETDPEFTNLKQGLQDIIGASPDIEYIYTMRSDPQGNIVFVVDAERVDDEVNYFGVVYPDPGPVLAANFETISKPTLEDEFYSDEYGEHLSGYAPIYDSTGKREAVLGMDVSANTIVAQERLALTRSAGIFALSTLSLLLIGWTLGNVLSASVIKLADGAAKFSEGDLSFRVNVRSRDEISTLAQAYNAMAERVQELVQNLERRVDDRTVALSRRTSQLQASARVARAAAAIKEPVALLNEVARLISEQFDFYHAGIFLLDENSEYAILQAASSEGGKLMLERGHRLQVGGQGIVGYVAAQKRPRIALDTGADAVYFDNPDLPQTRSEAALPLIVRERVIGVLDIQSEKPQAFSPEDIETFQTLADQLALAIENARLFNQMEMTLNQISEGNSIRVNETWGNLARTKALAYQYTALGIQSIPQQNPEDAVDGKFKVAIPLHNQQIGEIRIKQKEGSEVWTEREKNMLTEIAAQVGLALENARLLNDAQQRAIRERAISEIAARIGAAHDVDSILRVTAQEIGKAISDSEVVVQIRSQELEAE